MPDDTLLDMKDIKRRMEGALNALKSEFSGLRTGRASASMLEPVKVEAYGSATPINQVGSINIPEPRLITIQVWDKSLVGTVEKALRSADLGINPVVDGQTIRIPIPELNEERRVEITKIASRYAEQARVAVRNVRRDGMDRLKRMEKEGEISQDDHKRLADELQSMTDEYVEKIDETFTAKEQEILQV